MEQLIKTILSKLQEMPDVQGALARANQGSDEAIHQLAVHLKQAMIDDPQFAVKMREIDMSQVNLDSSIGYQTKVEQGGTAIVGGLYLPADPEVIRVILPDLVRELQAANQPIGIPSNIPRSGVEKFVGRDKKLEQLHTQLQQGDVVAISAIAGMGGVGKTELAIQYAEKNKNAYPAGVCWLFSREFNIGTQIVGYAQAQLGLKIPDGLELSDQVAFCWRNWPVGDALIVLDDVVNYSDVEPYLPSKVPRFKVLMTTRQEFGPPIQTLPLEVLTLEASLELLESLIGKARIEQEWDIAKTLCEWLGYLPLGLELVGRFLAKRANQSLSLSTMLSRLEEKALKHRALIRKLDEPAWTLTAQRGVEAAFELSWEQLDEQVQRLGKLLSLFALAPIPWELVEHTAQKQFEMFPENKLFDLEELEESKETLISFHLLQNVSLKVYRLHSLIREFFRGKLEGEEAHAST
jgi:hypothetical protein